MFFLWKWGFVFNHNGKREEIRQGDRFEKTQQVVVNNACVVVVALFV